MTEKQTLNKIKAINERLAVYERQALTDSAQYQKIIERIKLEKLPTTFSKSGNIRISRSKTAISSISEQSLTRISNLGGLKEERAKARSKGYKTKKEQDEQIKNYGRLEKWAEENLYEVYYDAKAGMAEAQAVESMFDGDSRNMSYDEIWAIINKYEEAKKDRNNIMKNSKYWKFDDDLSGGDMASVFDDL